MAEIQWEREFDAAVKRAVREGKPVYQDFWFEG